MNPVNKARITELFQEFRKAVGSLRKLQVAIDICNHIIAEERLGQPREYAEVFRVMGEAGIFPEDLVRRLEQMAKFRNLLVHLYGEVDDRQVYEILQTRLGDFEQFEFAIQDFLRRFPGRD